MSSVDFDKAAQQAGALDQAAQCLYAQSDRMGKIVSELSALWHGDTADVYIRELNAFSGQLRLEAKRCSIAAEAFHARITEFQDTEIEEVLPFTP